MKLKIITIFTALLLVVSSCQDFDEINTNPNQATDAGINVIYPAVTASFIYGLNGEVAQFTSILMQYLTGVLGDHQQINSYSFVVDMSDTPWNRFYADCLINIKTIKEKAEEENATHYLGAVKVMEAVILGFSVDLWNDIPYNQALDLQTTSQPAFDPANEVYAQVQRLLDEAIEHFQSESAFSPGSNDFVYPATNEIAWRANSLPKWILLARGMKARYHNHLSKVDPQGSATATLAAIDAGTFESNADEPRIVFGSEFAGPWFPFLNTTFGENNIGVSQRFIDMLRDRLAEDMDDPRLPFFVRDLGAGLYVGTENGATSKPDGAANVGTYLFRREAPTPLLNYSEIKFIEAEAALRLNQNQRAAEAFNDAVEASLLRVTGSGSPEYLAVFASETAASISFEKIMEEKHIDMYLQMEAWVDWRRSIPAGADATTSGIPTLVPSPSNSTNGAFPRRFEYPQRETVNNSANVPQVTKLDKIFWDN